MKNSLIAVTISSLLLTATAHAEEKKTQDEHKYKASAELGFLYKTGNSKSGDIKTGFDFEHEYQKWRNELKASLLYRKTEVIETDALGNATEEFETSDQKFTLDAKTNYSLTKKPQNYLYGSFGFVDDRFSSFDYQATISAGWGKKWFETKTSSFFADIGPGFKRDRLAETSENEDAFIVQAQALYTTLINEHVQFKQLVRATQAFESDENSVYRSETSLTTKLIETLQVKFSFIVDHNTEVADDKENTDTQTAVTLVYSF
jgi:putative salt-induced outer membrane protein YdiY